MPDPQPFREKNYELDIAVVGMACRFPGARNLEEFWHNLVEGVESITKFSDEELLRSGVSQYPDLLQAEFEGTQPHDSDSLLHLHGRGPCGSPKPFEWRVGYSAGGGYIRAGTSSGGLLL